MSGAGASSVTGLSLTLDQTRETSRQVVAGWRPTLSGLRSIPLLDEAAIEAVRHWTFSPSIVNGQPVPVRMTVVVNFTP